MHVYLVQRRPSPPLPPPPPPWLPPLTGPIIYYAAFPGWVVWVVGLFNPRSSPCGVVVGFGFNPPPLLSPPVMWCGAVVGCGFQVYCLITPHCGVVVGVGLRVCTPAPPVVWVVGFRV